MKSPDPGDPSRLEVTDAQALVSLDCSELTVTVTFRYEPWEPSPAMNVLWEKARALDCVRGALERGGVGECW